MNLDVYNQHYISKRQQQSAKRLESKLKLEFLVLQRNSSNQYKTSTSSYTSLLHIADGKRLLCLQQFSVTTESQRVTTWDHKETS